MATKQLQAQKQKTMQRQSVRQLQLQKTLQYQIPLLLQKPEEEDQIDESQEPENDPAEFVDDPETDTSAYYDDMSGDEEDDEFGEPDEDVQIVFRHYPVAEINLVGDELVISTKRQNENGAAKLLRSAVEVILRHNEQFIRRVTADVVPVSQTELANMAGVKRDVISKFIKNNYISLPDSQTYSISHFYSHELGRPSGMQKEHMDFLMYLIDKERADFKKALADGMPLTSNMLYNDTRLVEEFKKKFGKAERRTVARMRESLNIPQFELRKGEYLADNGK